MARAIRAVREWFSHSPWRIAVALLVALAVLVAVRPLTRLAPLVLLLVLPWAAGGRTSALPSINPARWATAVAAVATLAAGSAVFQLTPDSSDNAWLIFVPVMWWSAVSSVGFIAATVMPSGWRRRFATGSLVVFLLFGGFALLFLVPEAINADEKDLLGNDFRGPVRSVLALSLAVFIAIPSWFLLVSAGGSRSPPQGEGGRR